MRESDRHILADHYLDLYRMAYGILHNQSEAEDAVQEALARTLARPMVQHPLHYCMKVLHHYCIDKLRDECMLTDKMDKLDVADAAEDTATQQLLKVRLEMLDEARKYLPQRTNQLLDMHYVEGLSIQEISEQSGVSIVVVRKLFKRAYRQMRKRINTIEINDIL